MVKDLQSGPLERTEDIVLSPVPTALLSVGWGVTTYELLHSPDDFYGGQIGNEKIQPYADHLHLGYGLHMVGFCWKRWHPSSYRRLPYGARLVFLAGNMVQWDDMYQHLYLQQHDGFDVKAGKAGNIEESPLHLLYVWAEQPERTGDCKLMLDLFRAGNLTLSAGFFQGLAAETSYRILDFARPRSAIHLKGIIGVGIIDGEVKRLGVEQVITGVSFNIYPTRWCSLEVGSGLRLYRDNPRLKETVPVFYGIQFGPPPRR